MKAALTKEIRSVDKQAIEEFGIPGVVLMENAGTAVVRQMEKNLGTLQDKRVCIFAGKGNNGGDGYVIARHLYNKGVKVKVFLLGHKSDVAGDAKINLDILHSIGLDVIEVLESRDWDKVKIGTTFADYLIDALLGTGYKGELSDNMLEAVSIINHSGKVVIAVDVPSGVNADNGQVVSSAVLADYTVTFSVQKPGLLFYPGAQQAGKVFVEDIGIPAVLSENSAIKQNAVRANEVRSMLMKRHPAAHKGMCGRVAVLAGSTGLTGAAVLASMSAMRAGAGLVTLGVPESLHNIVEVKLTEVMTKPLPEIAGGAIGAKAVPTFCELAAKADVAAVGPGLGQEVETSEALRELIGIIEKPLVLDADALNALSDMPQLLKKTKALAVITPHPGEMARLTGLSVEEINSDRMEVARMSASDWNCIVVLKGAPTVVAFPDGEVYINTTGNAGMATGGAGDVLTGIIAAFIAQGLSSHDAAVAGVYVHGLAGDIAAKTGTIGRVAGDIAAALPAAIYGLQSV
ncbi:MAG: NAD(P)H-hydrate dehydratase [Pelosinus sp.]|nr:NAD(P)H-hydrate dehydratase [Pelosinus sp.]